MNVNSLRYCTRQSVLSVYRNKWLALVTAGIIAISLAILGGFMLMAVNAGQLIRNVESNVEIAVFLDNGADVDAVRTKLDALTGLQSYIFVSREEGLELFGRSLGDKALLNGLEGENNPLPELFRVNATQADLVPSLAKEISTIPGVETAEYGEEMVGRLAKVTGWLNTLFLTVSALLALGAVFLIVTTIRLSVMARLDEISIMKYLGASNWYIRFPFLLEGMVIGWLGTVFAVSALGFSYYRLAATVQREALAFFLQPVTDTARLLPIFAGMILLGILMGGAGSLVAVRKYLRV